MHDDLARSAFGQCARTVKRALLAFEAQAHLRRDRNLRRHRAPHFADDGMQQFRLLEQHRAATRLVHRFGRATEVKVDHRSAERAGEGGVVRQALRIGAEKLYAHRRTGPGA